MNRLLLYATLVLLSACSNPPAVCDNVAGDDWKSYYNPQHGTFGIRNGLNPCNVEVVGEKLEGFIVVGSDQANSVRLVGNGWDSMMFVADRSVNGLYVDNDQVRFSVAESTVELGFNGDLKSTSVTYAKRCTTPDLICGDDGVYLGTRRFPAQFPRDAARAHGLVVVADTFGHSVSIYRERDGSLVDSFPVYYPNSVQVVGRKVIVAAEHQNQILEIDLDTRARRILFGCDLDLYANADLTIEELVGRELSGSLTRDDGRGICEGHLYSPNQATLYDDGTLLIADTDNHRVLVVRDGAVKTEIRNLNNPTRAAFWRAGKRVAQ